ncbi:MAG: ATP-binding protein [Candidatus Thorarchaeota archaeon]
MIETLRDLLNQDENENLDFKLKLPLGHRSERKEFAKDICCFANANGGYIVVGVEDRTRNRIGIPPESLDRKRIMKVGRERITPPVHEIHASEIEYEGVNYGLIEIVKTNQVHQVEGVVYIRKEDNCIIANTDTITELVRKSREYSLEQARLSQERELSSYPEIESQRAEEILDKLLNTFYGAGLVERIDPKRRESRWILRRTVENQLNSFAKACSVTIDTETPCPEVFHDMLRIRAIGLLALAQIGNDPTEIKKTRLVLEYDPTLANQIETEQSLEFLFDWMREFRNQPRSIFEPFPKSMGIGERASRIEQQMKLTNEFLSLTKDIPPGEVNPMTMGWAMLTGLVTDSLSQLSSGKSRSVNRAKKRMQRY